MHTQVSRSNVGQVRSTHTHTSSKDSHAHTFERRTRTHVLKQVALTHKFSHTSLSHKSLTTLSHTGSLTPPLHPTPPTHVHTRAFFFYPILRRGLQTTATFDKSTDEFILETPTLQSIKFWPSNLGRSATHCTLYAQLLIDDREYGVHVFWLQVGRLFHTPSGASFPSFHTSSGASLPPC